MIFHDRRTQDYCHFAFFAKWHWFSVVNISRYSFLFCICACLNSCREIVDIVYRVSVSRRTFGPSSVNVHAWLAATPLLTKCIWTMAVAQHQFYLDRKQSEVCQHYCQYDAFKRCGYYRTLIRETMCCN